MGIRSYTQSTASVHCMEALTLAEFERAAERIHPGAVRTPLIKLNVDPSSEVVGGAEIFLKLETLQPIGSFKLRGALNAMRAASPEDLVQGVWTASAGNMAQGVAFGAKQLGVKCSVCVPDNAPPGKVAAIKNLGAEVVKVDRT